MTLPSRIIALVVVSVFLCGANVDANQVSSFGIYPQQTLPLSFSHEQHLRLGTSCETCHREAQISTRSQDRLLPNESVCSQCHMIDRTQPQKSVAQGQPPARCSACHRSFQPDGRPSALIVPAPNLVFNHRLHLQQGATCIQCHGDLLKDRVALATRNHLPGEETCLTCHNGKLASARCDVCHNTTPDGRLASNDKGPMPPPKNATRIDVHDPMFVRDHRVSARVNRQSCDSCHRESFCTTCHDGVVKPHRIHTNDYLTFHGIEARQNTMDCSSCHRLQTFCVGCHTRSGASDEVLTTGFGRRSENPNAKSFHPAGWFDGFDQKGRGALHHSFQAQRNISSCASCHREDFCMQCHSETFSANRINPHPRNWSGSLRCRALSQKNPRVCYRCHVAESDIRCD